MKRRSRSAKTIQALLGDARSEPGLPEILARIDAWLYRRRRRMRLALRPGLEDAQVQLIGDEPGGIPPELLTLLSWHDGQTDDFRGTFADGWRLLSAEQIRSLTADLNADPPPGWSCGWVPFARDDSDSFLIVDPSTAGRPVRAVWSGRFESELLAPSLTSWFATLLADFQANRYVEDLERGTFLNTGRTGANRRPDEVDEVSPHE